MQSPCSCNLPPLLFSASDTGKNRKSAEIGVRLFEDTECTICFGPLITEVRTDDPVVGRVQDDEIDLAERLVEVLGACGHTFHTRCLKAYYNVRSRPWLCPKDNTELLPTDITRLEDYNPASDASKEADRRALITRERDRQAEKRMEKEMEKEMIKSELAELEKLKLETRFADDVEDDESDYLSAMNELKDEYIREQKASEKKRLDNLKKRAKKKEKQTQELKNFELSMGNVLEIARNSIKMSGNNEGHQLLTDYEDVTRVSRFMSLNGFENDVFLFNINLPEKADTATKYMGYVLKTTSGSYALLSYDEFTLSTLDFDGDNEIVSHDYRITEDMRNKYTFFWSMFVFSTLKPGIRTTFSVYLRRDKTLTEKISAVDVARTENNQMIVVTTSTSAEKNKIATKVPFNKIAGFVQIL